MSTDQRVIQVEGSSMAPYIQDGELLQWSPCQSFQNGDIVIFKNPHPGTEFIVHRFLSGNVIKGDRVKWTDQEIFGSIQPIGVARRRLSLKDTEPTPLLSQHFLNKLLCFFSKRNQYRYPVVHRLNDYLVERLGRLLYKTESAQDEELF